jgi:hypothetical protein
MAIIDTVFRLDRVEMNTNDSPMKLHVPGIPIFPSMNMGENTLNIGMHWYMPL